MAMEDECRGKSPLMSKMEEASKQEKAAGGGDDDKACSDKLVLLCWCDLNFFFFFLWGLLITWKKRTSLVSPKVCN